MNLRPSKSINAQLTLSYSLLSSILIILTACVFYGAMLKVLHNADEQFIEDEITILSDLIKKNTNDKAIKQEVQNIPKSLEHAYYHYYIRISKPDYSIETPNMRHIQFGLKENQNIWWNESNNQYVLKQISLMHNGEKYQIQVALDISYQQQMIDRYSSWVFYIVFFGVFISFALGYLISKQGMKKLKELTCKTTTITTENLNQRIESTDWPKELTELGEAYNGMLDRLEKSFQELTQLSDDLAHELRTPITNLKGESEIALSQNYSNEDFRQLIESNIEELDRIYQIIENLLFLAKSENHRVLPTALIDIPMEMKVLCNFYQSIADEKNIKLILEGNGEIEVNVTMFRRLIGNVLSNALKYTHNNGTISIGINNLSDHVEIRIADNGIGISSENLPHVFKRFYRVDDARSSIIPGMGLGLALAKSIMELHKGNIKITSELNRGTIIYLNFPNSKSK